MKIAKFNSVDADATHDIWVPDEHVQHTHEREVAAGSAPPPLRQLGRRFSGRVVATLSAKS
jgi:hypothetical protein